MSEEKKPLQLAFDPMHDENLRRVFEDDIARKFWLLYRPYCIVSHMFWSTCLGLSELWKRDNPKNELEFAQLLSSLGEFHQMEFKGLVKMSELLFDKMSQPEPAWEVVQ